MEEISVQIARLEVWSDLVKIGVPALVGLISGLVVGLVPYFIERQRLKDLRREEALKFRREQLSDLVDSLSMFSGHLYRYVSAQQSLFHNSNEATEEYVSQAGQEMLANEYCLKKARAIAGLIGKKELSDSLEEYDRQATATIKSLIKRVPDLEESIDSLKRVERQVLDNLDQLL